MPLVSRIMIRLALLYFLVGVLIGALMLVNKASGFYPQIWGLLPIHIEIMIFGWIIQFTLGTGYWMLPRLVVGKPRGNTRLALLLPLLWNLGILIMISGYLVFPNTAWRLLGRVLETLAVPVFIALHWKRVSPQIHID